MNRVKKRAALALALATVLTGATWATAAAGTTTPTTKSAISPAVTGTPLAATLLMPDAPSHVSAVLSYSGAAAVPTARGKATFADLVISRSVDPVTVFLHQRVVTQATLSKGVALVLTPAGATQPTTKITLGGVSVTSDQFSGATGSIPQESVALHYTAIEVDYYTANGTGGFNDAKMCWDLTTQTATCPTPVH
ncbi:type VI secretion system tube protein Hcp [Streptacidiphilus sp. EB103A]|uniref:type VI secretion system tube protein Hcp n=1 Tax=Streptacidiphilus sp. EB103A TaxID=3156275 RepID=UPI0035182586